MRVFIAALPAIALLCALSAQAEAQGTDPFQSNPATQSPTSAPASGPLPATHHSRRPVARQGGQMQPAAQQGQPGWTLDREVGCNAWNVDPTPSETVRWEGQCSGGMVNGQGHLQWIGGDGSILRDEEGQFASGHIEGHSSVAWADGTRYNGEWHNGRPHGVGQIIMPSGVTYNGVWSDGCFKDGDRRAAINRDLSSCP